MSALIDTDRARATATAAQSLVASLAASVRSGDSHVITLALPDDELQHARWFDEGTIGPGARRQPPRPFIAPTPDVRVQPTILRTGALDWIPALTAAGNSLRLRWAQALVSGTSLRTPWAALSPRYAARKARRGQPTTPGWATGQMATAIASGVVSVRRTG